MNNIEVIEIARNAIFTLITIGGPVVFVALIVGLSISLIQALTQIQEMTLSFVPKIIAVFSAIIIFLPFMLAHLIQFTHDVFDRITTLSL